jgi:hypothetical protein
MSVVRQQYPVALFNHRLDSFLVYFSQRSCSLLTTEHRSSCQQNKDDPDELMGGRKNSLFEGQAVFDPLVGSVCCFLKCGGHLLNTG